MEDSREAPSYTNVLKKLGPEKSNCFKRGLITKMQLPHKI
jgi:hypothetical protein